LTELLCEIIREFKNRVDNIVKKLTLNVVEKRLYSSGHEENGLFVLKIFLLLFLKIFLRSISKFIILLRL
jgi:hypothetical protein